MMLDDIERSHSWRGYQVFHTVRKVEAPQYPDQVDKLDAFAIL
ncbi:hypothetical protein [Asticcacaulis biprosthecium]|nr:hypothetical protein [Asticcacaulis biprosthecium]